MALALADRVKETSTTTGTGTIDLAGAVEGFQTFVAGIGSGNTTFYAIEDADGIAWEVGIGTVTDASPDTLARTTVLASTNSDNAITLSSGTHTIFGTYPAGKAVYLDASGKITPALTLDYLDDVSYGGTNLSSTLLINAAPGSAPTHGTLGSDCQFNIGIGNSCLSAMTDGVQNVALGAYALTTLTEADYNVAIGYESFKQLTTGDTNIGIGWKVAAHPSNSITGASNIGIGREAMYTLSSGSSNTALGYRGLYSVTSTHYNIGIGYNAGLAHTGSSMLFIANESESSNGTLIKGDMANKFLAIGKADVTLATEDATLQVYPDGTNDSAYFAKMPGSHTGDLIRTENSSGTVLFKVDKDGDITANTITTSESPIVPYTTITGDTTVTTSNAVVFANAASGAIDITMYTADTNGGRTLIVKKTDSSANAVILLRAASETIDGETSLTLSIQNESVTLVSDNSNWFIV